KLQKFSQKFLSHRFWTRRLILKNLNICLHHKSG
ncbi:hypothetical protein X975_02065, partial [Stegodyphus mimosarum]